MKKLLFWVLLCLPALAYAQNTRDAFLESFEDMDKEGYKYRLSSIGDIISKKNTLPTALFESLYIRDGQYNMEYAKENYTIYPIGKIKNSEGIYSFVYFQSYEIVNQHGKAYVGNLFAKTIDFNNQKADYTYVILDFRSMFAKWEDFLSVFRGMIVSHAICADKIIFMNTAEQDNSGIFEFDKEAKTYKRR